MVSALHFPSLFSALHCDSFFSLMYDHQDFVTFELISNYNRGALSNQKCSNKVDGKNIFTSGEASAKQ